MDAGESKELIQEAYQNYGYLIKQRCLAILREQNLAEDALQQTFVRMTRYIESYHRAPAKLFWLFRACNQICFNLLKIQKRTRYFEGQLFLDGIKSDTIKDVELSIVHRDTLRHCFMSLDRQQRDLAAFAYIDGMTQSEIAKATGWSRQTINKKLKSIRKKIEYETHLSESNLRAQLYNHSLTPTQC